MKLNHIYNHTSETMPEIMDKSVDLMVTSPPYNINISYGNKWKERKIIQSKGVKYKDSMEEIDYRNMLKSVFNETKRVLKDNGQIWVNIKNRYLDEQIIPPFWLLEYFDDMFLKNIIIWNYDWGGSTNRRFCSRYEYLFFFTHDKKDFTFNLDDVKIPALNFRPDRYKSQLKNPSDVWRMSLVSGNSVERTDHPAQYPEELIERVIKVGTNPGDIVLDPFMGSGTTAVVAKKFNRNFIGYETNEKYIETAQKRLIQPQLPLQGKLF